MMESAFNNSIIKCDILEYIQRRLEKRGIEMNKYEKAILKEELTLRNLYLETQDPYYLAQYQAILMLEVNLDMKSFKELDNEVENLKRISNEESKNII